MKVYTCTDFTGHWPVGTSALIVAEDEQQACRLLMEKLATVGLSQKVDPHQLQQVNAGEPGATILQDGDY